MLRPSTRIPDGTQLYPSEYLIWLKEQQQITPNELVDDLFDKPVFSVSNDIEHSLWRIAYRVAREDGYECLYYFWELSDNKHEHVTPWWISAEEILSLRPGDEVELMEDIIKILRRRSYNPQDDIYAIVLNDNPMPIRELRLCISIGERFSDTRSIPTCFIFPLTRTNAVQSIRKRI